MTTNDEEGGKKGTDGASEERKVSRSQDGEPLISEQAMARVAWMSLVATSTMVLVTIVIVFVGVVMLLNEPEPVVFERELPALRIIANRPVPPMAEPEAPREAAEVLVPVAPTPPPAPEVPDDLIVDPSLVPGQLPDVAPLPELPIEDTAIEAAQALQSDRVTVGIASDPPGAEVRVEGRFRGRTPVKLMLNPGRYKIDLTLQSIEARWELDATESLRKCFSLQGSELLAAECP
ncbi:MAG: PEGA domain-containing protein [Myxococcota bacterium]